MRNRIDMKPAPKYGEFTKVVKGKGGEIRSGSIIRSMLLGFQGTWMSDLSSYDYISEDTSSEHTKFSGEY